MESTVKISLVGGPGDGETVTVELDGNHRPPLTHHRMGSEGLADAEIYELQSVTGQSSPWCYQWRGPAA